MRGELDQVTAEQIESALPDLSSFAESSDGPPAPY